MSLLEREHQTLYDKRLLSAAEGVPRAKGEMNRVVERCCGLDVHKASVTACCTCKL